jgi:hypothetical protein
VPDTAAQPAFLIQILLPTADNGGRPFPAATFERIKAGLAERFGGVTAYTRAPAEGVWAAPDAGKQAEDIVIVEVMAPELDQAWWRAFRRKLETLLDQEEIVIRAQNMTRL